MILAVTGHRPPKVGGYVVPNPIMMGIGNAIREDFARVTPERVLTGMALGVDQWVAWICIEMNIPYWAVIPCQGYESRWPDQAKSEYRHLLSQAERVHYVDGNQEYTPGCIMRRNKYLVDHCDQIYTVWNGVPDGGTYSTIKYAAKQRKPRIIPSIPDDVWEQARIFEGRTSAAQQELIPRNPPRTTRTIQTLSGPMHNSMGPPAQVDINEQNLAAFRMAMQVERNRVSRDPIIPFHVDSRDPNIGDNRGGMRLLEEIAARQQRELSERVARELDRQFMEAEPPIQATRDEFDRREEMNLNSAFNDTLENEIRRTYGVSLDLIRERGAPIRTPRSEPKPATIDTENRTTPRRFVDIGDDE